MAEPQSQKKGKKSKKKPETPEAAATANNESKNQITRTSDVNKNLPQEQNSKASGNVKEVMTNDKKEVNTEAAGKKKKKSKKSKEVSKETSAENINSQSLLNFSENGIHLVNHPEISVTITDASQLKDEIKPAADKIQEIDTKKQNDVDNNNSATPVTVATNTTDCPNAAKKKKKKKKKANGDNAPAVPPTTTTTTTTNENTIPTPTYTKVVTSDNTCVLVVNNEKFSVDSNLLQNTDSKKNKMPDKGLKFSLPSEKQLDSVLITKNFTSDTSIQFNNSVSIFPVLTNGNADVKKESVVSEVSISTQEAPVAENADESKPTKSQLKAERRAKQEAQRAAKLAKTNTKVDSNTNAAAANETKNIPSKEKTVAKEINPKIKEVASEKLPTKLPAEKESLHKVKLFSSLPQHKQFDGSSKIHPAILEIGFQYNKGIICGSNARCVALLEAFVEVIQDFNPQPDRSFCKDLESSIQSHLSFLANCRPLSVSMKNAVRFLKHEINEIPCDMEIEEIKERLCDFIHNFVKVEIVLAKEAVSNRVSYKILDGDVILVFSFSSVVRDVLCKAQDKGIIFRVIVVDARPKLEGCKMLRYLVKQGLRCSYISINAVSYIMKEVTKVIIGAHAVLSDGCVLSRLGNKQIALVAAMFGVPVFVCCETYKFCELVLRDSFVHNELADPEDIISTALISNDSLKNWRDLPSLQPLNLMYDLTTPDLISQIITEKRSMACTSVPLVLKMKFAGLPP